MAPIKEELVELLTPIGNGAVVRLPGRRYPGVVIQGDSLSILVRHIREIRVRVDKDDEALLDEALLLEEELEEYRRGYEQALALHGIELPYVLPSK